MNDLAISPDLLHNHAAYICRRVIDTLLRENVRECVTRGRIVAASATPFFRLLTGTRQQGDWLAIEHLGEACLWLPVVRGAFLQDWKLRELPVVWLRCGHLEWLHDVASILTVFRQGLDAEAAREFAGFDDECLTAIEHLHVVEAEKARRFREVRSGASPHWDQRMRHYDWLASFLDHPLYPTARAKLGFSTGDLQSYGPEFQHPFELHWLAVERERYHGASAPVLPDFWPTPAQLGLSPQLAHTHALVPVHPFMWHGHLDALLAQNGLQHRIRHAPGTHLEVLPTLSVRTVALKAHPEWHIKLPLPIRTLGAKNIRTIKPVTIADGHTVQSLLRAIADQEPEIGGRLLLTDERLGAHVEHKYFLGFILRRYPRDLLADATVVPVAGLLATTPQGNLVIQELAGRFYGGDTHALLEDYLDTTLQLHLRLWLCYGIALESNQQNSLLVLSDGTPRLRLLLKDNDSPRIWGARLAARGPSLADWVRQLQDQRLVVTDELPLAQMFTTITLQLNIAVLIEGLAANGAGHADELYQRVRLKIEALLGTLARQGEDITLARRTLLEDDRIYIKYLLTAASLASKQATGAADINKYYGKSARNFLKPRL